LAYPRNYFEYIAETGDTYGSVAKKFKIGENELRGFNGGAELSSGAVVKIPVAGGGCARGAFYVIRSTDTLKRISERFAVPVDSLLAANPYLNPAHYIPGQIIIIPVSRKSLAFYTLGEGERLVGVLKKYGMDLSMFCALNPGVDPLALCAGMRVCVRKKSGALYRRYTLKPGDTPASVAGRFGISAGCLLAANCAALSSFAPGMVIRVPPEES